MHTKGILFFLYFMITALGQSARSEPMPTQSILEAPFHRFEINGRKDSYTAIVDTSSFTILTAQSMHAHSDRLLAARYNWAGKLIGQTSTTFHSQMTLVDAQVLPSGEKFILYHFTNSDHGNGTSSIIAKFRSDGEIDTSFANRGYFDFDKLGIGERGALPFGTGISFDSSRRLLLHLSSCSRGTRFSSLYCVAGLAKLGLDGRVDHSMGRLGWIEIVDHLNSPARLIQTDYIGTQLLGLRHHSGVTLLHVKNTYYADEVFVYDDDGKLLSERKFLRLIGTQITEDNKILLLSYEDGNLIINKLNLNGSPDLSFANQGVAQLPVDLGNLDKLENPSFQFDFVIRNQKLVLTSVLPVEIAPAHCQNSGRSALFLYGTINLKAGFWQPASQGCLPVVGSESLPWRPDQRSIYSSGKFIKSYYLKDSDSWISLLSNGWDMHLVRH